MPQPQGTRFPAPGLNPNHAAKALQSQVKFWDRLSALADFSIDTLSAGIRSLPRIHREGGPDPAQPSSNHHPKGVAEFKSEWPTLSRNHRPPSNRNQWPTSVGIRLYWATARPARRGLCPRS